MRRWRRIGRILQVDLIGKVIGTDLSDLRPFNSRLPLFVGGAGCDHTRSLDPIQSRLSALPEQGARPAGVWLVH
jgi:hypothetical protein